MIRRRECSSANSSQADVQFSFQRLDPFQDVLNTLQCQQQRSRQAERDARVTGLDASPRRRRPTRPSEVTESLPRVSPLQFVPPAVESLPRRHSTRADVRHWHQSTNENINGENQPEVRIRCI